MCISGISWNYRYYISHLFEPYQSPGEYRALSFFLKKRCMGSLLQFHQLIESSQFPIQDCCQPGSSVKRNLHQRVQQGLMNNFY